MAAAVRPPNRIRNAARDAASTGLSTSRSRRVIADAGAGCPRSWPASVSVRRLERQRDTQRAGDLDLQEQLEVPALVVGELNGLLSSLDRPLERAPDGLNGVDGFLELGIDTPCRGGIELFQIVVDAGTRAAGKRGARAGEQRRQAIQRCAAQASLDQVRGERRLAALVDRAAQPSLHAGLDGGEQIVDEQVQLLLAPRGELRRVPTRTLPRVLHEARLAYELLRERPVIGPEPLTVTTAQRRDPRTVVFANVEQQDLERRQADGIGSELLKV